MVHEVGVPLVLPWTTSGTNKINKDLVQLEIISKMGYGEYKDGGNPYGNMAMQYGPSFLKWAAQSAWKRYSRKRKLRRAVKKASKKMRTEFSGYKNTRVKIDGTTGGQFRMTHKRGRKRKKKTMRQEIKQVRKLIPKKSRMTYRDFRTLYMSVAQNQRRVYDITMFTKDDLREYAQNLRQQDVNAVADYHATNSSVAMSLFYKLELKNNMTSNAKVSYVFFVCKDDDNEAPAAKIREDLINRGYIQNSVDGETAANYTTGPNYASYHPMHLNFNAGGYHYPVFGGASISRAWRQIGKVQNATLGPGDSTTVKFSRKLTYKPEVLRDEQVQTYLSGYDFRLVVVVGGDLGHDETNVNVVGRCAAKFDCEEQKQCVVTYGNAKGLNDVQYSDDLQNSVFTTPVKVDNHASAVEQDDQ